MTDGPAQTAYHPRWLRTRVSTYWWLERPSYFAFILREVSSVFVAWFVLYLLMLIREIAQGDASYRAFLAWSASPPVLALNLVTFGFVVFHAVTWFNLAPKAMVVKVRGRHVPGWAIALSNYAAWAVISAGVAWLLLGG
jgi:fumarate reductase subunit C